MTRNPSRGSARITRLADGCCSSKAVIVRNLTFVDQVVFMGLEMTGFTKANLDALWIDPLDYQGELAEAVHFLADSRTSRK